MSELNESGQEVFDQSPVFCPIKFDRPIPLHMRIREQILLLNEEMRNQSEVDSPDDADDFEIDGEEWVSPYEVDFDHISQEMKGDVSKEESASGGSSGGTPQAEQSDASSSDPVTASPSE